jgi:hypothetical protein
MAIATLVACKSDSSFIFEARRFDAALMCLDPYTGVDVVSGDSSGGCTPVCLTNAGEHYVTEQCPPYPPLFGVYAADAGDSVCAAAFAAFARGATCDADGGVSYPDAGDAGDANVVDAGDANVVDASDAASE